MTNGTTLSVPPIHLPLIHGENVFVDHLSDLAALISDSAVLAKVERNPSLRAAILSNPFLIREISHNHALLNILASNPALLGAVISNPRILRVIKENPAIVEEILRNPAWSIEMIFQNISERNKLNKPEENMKNIAEKKPTQSQVLRKSEKPVVMTKARSAIKETIVKVGAGERKIPINIPNVKTIEGKVQAKIPLIRKQSAGIYIDPRTLATHPSLLALLAATAFSANRTKIIPMAGNLEDWGIGEETQSETQESTLQELNPVREVEEASEVHLMKETVA